jgi:hypothetical protein
MWKNSYRISINFGISIRTEIVLDSTEPTLSLLASVTSHCFCIVAFEFRINSNFGKILIQGRGSVVDPQITFSSPPEFLADCNIMNGKNYCLK